ncbi:MAG: hypothetical protein WC516_02065 [Patescibacteria group bacterium]
MKIKNSKIILINFCLAIGTYIVLDRWRLVAATFFILWLIGASFLAFRLMKRVLPDQSAINWLLGIFASLWLVASVANIFCSWLALNNLTIFLSLIITTIVLATGDLLSRNHDGQRVEAEDKARFKFSNWWLVLLLALLALGFWVVWQAVSGSHLTSPWQVLPNWYAVIIFGVFLLTGFMVFSRRSRGLILLMIILASLLIHSYLLVYNNGFGADRWRHLGSEVRIAQGLEYQPTLLTNNLWWSKIGPVAVPRALIDGPKLSYGFEWSLSIIGVKVFGVNFFDLDKYLVPILWSIFLPLLIFALARGIWPQKQFALLAALASSAFYLLQYYGSQTLPASLGLLSFVLFLVFIVHYLNHRNKLALGCAIFTATLMYFGYSLAFILALVILLIVALNHLRSPVKYVLMGLVALSIFLLELANQSWTISMNHDLLAFWRDGNLAFFNWGKSLFSAHWLIVLINVLVIVVYILAGRLLCHKKSKEWRLIILGIIIILVNYILSWQLLAGEHSLSRRLTLFVAPLIVLLVAWLITEYGSKNKVVLGAMIVVFALFSSLAYASGPTLNIAVSDSDMATAKYIWLKINSQEKNYCVLAGDSQLLPLEALSGKEMIAGNFPNDANHQQPERLRLLTQAINDPSISTFVSALTVTKKRDCFLILNQEEISQNKLNKINSFLGEPEMFNNNYLWRFRDNIIKK